MLDMHEVIGSIPIVSTNKPRMLLASEVLFVFICNLKKRRVIIVFRILPADEHLGSLVVDDDYTAKSIDEEKMLLRIKALFRRTKIASERRIAIGDDILDRIGVRTRTRNDKIRGTSLK